MLTPYLFIIFFVDEPSTLLVSKDDFKMLAKKTILCSWDNCLPMSCKGNLLTLPSRPFYAVNKQRRSYAIVLKRRSHVTSKQRRSCWLLEPGLLAHPLELEPGIAAYPNAGRLGRSHRLFDRLPEGRIFIILMEMSTVLTYLLLHAAYEAIHYPCILWYIFLITSSITEPHVADGLSLFKIWK